MAEFFWLLLLVLMAWAWWIDRGVQQYVYDYVKRFCENENLQLLDENVRLSGIWLKRNARGHLSIWRGFKFEFTSTGEKRYFGRVETLGGRVIDMDLDPYNIN